MKKVKIGIEARVLCNTERRGVAQYIFRLLSAVLSTDTQYEYYILVDEDINPINIINHPNFHVVKIPHTKGWQFNSWLHYSLTKHLISNKYDLVYFPHNVLPIITPCKTVVGIHDVKLLRKRATYLGRYVVDGGKYLGRAIRRANKVICMSNFTKSELETEVGRLNNAVVIHEGISSIYKPLKKSEEDLQSIKRKYGIKNKYVMTLGASAKYKNIDFLVRSYAKLGREFANSYQLLIVGHQANGEAEYLHTIEKMKLHENVLCTGYVTDEQLVALYNYAECFVYPSLYEGFGFPPLEAMACGTPCIASNTSSIPEIVANGCITVDVTNEDSFSNALFEYLVKLKKDSYRQKVISRGFRRAKEFSWEKTARNTLKVFNALLS